MRTQRMMKAEAYLHEHRAASGGEVAIPNEAAPAS